ncbi:hypothetical protein HZS_5429 [Henneguya salminicola]|nr:hypothetical protein HZS_5429 [Henneguya salminicola]
MEEDLRAQDYEKLNELRESSENVLNILESCSGEQNQAFLNALELTKSSSVNLKQHIDTINEISKEKSKQLKNLVEKCENIEKDFKKLNKVKHDIKIIKESLTTLYNLLIAMQANELPVLF